MASNRELEIAADIARTSPVPLDQLPYTETFEIMYSRFLQAVRKELSRNQFFALLLGVRKRGMLGPRQRHRRSRPTRARKENT